MSQWVENSPGWKGEHKKVNFFDRCLSPSSKKTTRGHPDGPAEHIFECFLPVPDGPDEHIFEGFLPVPDGPPEHIFEGVLLVLDGPSLTKNRPGWTCRTHFRRFFTCPG